MGEQLNKILRETGMRHDLYQILELLPLTRKSLPLSEIQFRQRTLKPWLAPIASYGVLGTLELIGYLTRVTCEPHRQRESIYGLTKKGVELRKRVKEEASHE
jgi:DNA-binding PadR family transcriptional regulator